MNHESRRAFLGKAAVAAPAAAVFGAAASTASAVQSREGRRVIPGRADAPFSRATILDRIVFVAGVVGRKPGSRDLASTEFEPQCRQAFENLKASVESAGSRMAQVLKCTCFLTDVADFGAMNRLFRAFFPSDPPARSTVVVKELVVPGAKIEVDCVASLG